MLFLKNDIGAVIVLSLLACLLTDLSPEKKVEEMLISKLIKLMGCFNL